jgi:hypothetical protein
MSRILHVARTDVRRWWSLALASVAVIAGDRVLSAVGPAQAMRQPSLAGLLDMLAVMVGVTLLVIPIVLVGVIVHETPLVGARAFWQTRPLPVRDVVVAKLLTLGIIVVAVPVAADAIVLAQRGLPFDLVLLDALESAVGMRLIGLLFVLFLAMLTRSLVTYLVALVGSLLGLLVVAMTMVAIAIQRAEPDASAIPRDPPVPIPDLSGAFQSWVGMLLTLAVPILVLAIWRSPRRALAALAVLVALAPIPQWPPVPDILPKLSAAAPEWATRDGALQLGLDAPEAIVGWARQSPNDMPPIGVDPRAAHAVHAPVHMTAPPSGWFAEIVAIRSRFATADGATVTGGVNVSGQSLPSKSTTSPPLSRFNAWEMVTGRDVRGRFAAFTSASTPARIALASFPRRQDAATLLRGPVRYDGEAFLDLWALSLTATFDGAPGRVQQDGHLIEIVRVRRDPDKLSVLVRKTALSPLLRPAIAPTWFVVLKDRGTTTALGGDQTWTRGTLVSVASRSPLSGWSFEPAQGSGNEWQTIDFRVDHGLPIDPTWMDRAQIAIVSMRYAGRVSRQLRVKQLSVREMTAVASPDMANPRDADRAGRGGV